MRQQPAWARQRGDEAQVARGAGVPVGGVAGAPGGRRHVRPGRGVVALGTLLGARHARALRRVGRAAGRGAHRRAARGLPARGQGAIEASLELADELEAAWHHRMIEDSGRWPDRRTGRYTNFLDTTSRSLIHFF